MKIVGISGSTLGSKTRTAVEYALAEVKKQYPLHDVTLIDLKEYDIVFSDGRNYWEYEGDTKQVLETIMSADALIIGTPTFQASIPATLKNIFDLLPINGFRDKVVALIATAGSAKHYLMVDQQLKPIISYMKGNIVPTYVFIEEKDFLRKDIINDDVVFRLERLAEDTVLLVEAYQHMREIKDAQYDF